MNFDERATTPYAALLLRVSMGVMFLAHGLLLKVMTFGLAGTMGYFGSIGYPPVFGAIVAFAEIAAGIALIAGVWVRLVSLLALPIMIGAVMQARAGCSTRRAAAGNSPPSGRWRCWCRRAWARAPMRST